MSPLSQFQEDYALKPESRPDLLKTLPPGTEEHYLYHLQYLSQQLQTGQIPVTAQAIDEATALLTEAENSNVVTDWQQLNELKTQFALLAFPVKPDVLLTHLNYDPGMANVSQDPDGGDGEGQSSSLFSVHNLPTSLDQNSVKTDVLMDKLLKRIQDNVSSVDIPDDAWPHLLAQPQMEAILEELDIDPLQTIFDTLDVMYSPKSLEIVGRADSSRFDQVVVKMILRLYNDNKVDFMDPTRSQFQSLTRSQLEVIKKEQPQVMHNEGFVGLLERRIIPEPFPESEDKAYEEWLERMLVFVDELSPKFNRYKLAVYLLSLEHDVAKGLMDKAKFLRYVAVPRDQIQYNQQTLRSHDRELLVDLAQNQGLSYWSN
ncbi:hypothetical protein EDD11_000908, partial [Mortierella claussenii]